MERADHSDDSTDLDPADDAWVRNRSAIAPLAFGVVGMALSPLLLGLFAGPIGVRTGMDLWRGGTRRPAVAVGIASSMLAIVLSTIAALLWGSVLSAVLLGRDAMRETESWRGREVEARSVQATTRSGAREITLRPAGAQSRLLVVALLGSDTPSQQFLTVLAEALPRHPECGIILVDMGDAAGLSELAASAGVDAPVIRSAAILPAPLDRISGIPTTVVIDPNGRIESALVGSRPASEVERLMSGAGALAQPAPR